MIPAKHRDRPPGGPFFMSVALPWKVVAQFPSCTVPNDSLQVLFMKRKKGRPGMRAAFLPFPFAAGQEMVKLSDTL